MVRLQGVHRLAPLVTRVCKVDAPDGELFYVVELNIGYRGRRFHIRVINPGGEPLTWASIKDSLGASWEDTTLGRSILQEDLILTPKAHMESFLESVGFVAELWEDIDTEFTLTDIFLFAIYLRADLGAIFFDNPYTGQVHELPNIPNQFTSLIPGEPGAFHSLLCELADQI
jgi:hypothetical protein